MEDIEHVVIDCPKYKKQRETLHKKIKKKTRKQTEVIIRIEEILKHPTKSEAKFLTEFLKNCKLSI